MLLRCLQFSGKSALQIALSHKDHDFHDNSLTSVVKVLRVLLLDGNADYSDCKGDEIVKEVVVKYRQGIVLSLDPWLQVPDLCEIVAGYCFEFLQPPTPPPIPPPIPPPTPPGISDGGSDAKVKFCLVL